MNTSREFAIGKLVMAITENEGAARGLPPALVSDGNKVRKGNTGEIFDGPDDTYGPGRRFWAVQWADGHRTWSAERGLLVIGDKGQAQDILTTDKVPVQDTA